jgi:WD40 repeat protein
MLHTWRSLLSCIIAAFTVTAYSNDTESASLAASVGLAESQVTDQSVNHILTNINVWSPDSKWIVCDTRSDAAGEKFDGSTIEIVNVETGEIREIYRSKNGAHCGVATFSPKDHRVVFILGPENPTADWQYGPFHRQGVVVDVERPGVAANLDARDLMPPFTAGAHRGGTHVHVFDADGAWVSSTYEDHVLAMLDANKSAPAHQPNQRNIAVSVPGRPVTVAHDHPRNHNGTTFTVLVTKTTANPRPGSDEISRACEEGWVGVNGYVRADGTRQRRSLAFQGHVTAANCEIVPEVFVVDLPDDPTCAGDAALAGTETTMPVPPPGVTQRRLTFTTERKFPGIQGPRHWLRSSPDGSQIAFLMRDDDGIVQVWSVSPNGGEPRQLTRERYGVASAISWSPGGHSIAFIADNSVFTVNTDTGNATRLTPRTGDADRPRPEACVYSPNGRRIAYIRPITRDGNTLNQIFVVQTPKSD